MAHYGLLHGRLHHFADNWRQADRTVTKISYSVTYLVQLNSRPTSFSMRTSTCIRILARDLNGSGAFQFGCPNFWILAPTTQFPPQFPIITPFVRWLIDWLSSALPSPAQDWLNALLSASVEMYRLTCNNSGFSRLFAKLHWRRISSQKRRITNCGFEWIDIRRL